MKIRLNLIILMIIALSLTMCQCSLNQQELYQGKPLIKVDIAWRSAVYQNANFAYLVIGNTAYIPEGDGVAAVNLDNGAIKWRINGTFVPGSNIEKIGDYLYVFEDYSAPAESAISNDITYVRIAKIKIDGTSIEMMLVGSEKGWKTRMAYLSSDNTYLYWGSYDNRFIKLNPSTLEKEVIYTTTNEFMSKILISNNIAYVGHIAQARTTPGTITAINLSNNTVLWEKTPNIQKYFSAFCLVINNDRLYDFDNLSTACYDINNGNIIFDTSKVCGGSYGGGIFDDKNIYYTSAGSTGSGVYGVNNSTGEKIWYDDVGYTLGGTPQLNHGILYVDAITHLRLYNATNGQIIGVTPNVKGQSFQLSPTQRYGDLMIICGDDGMVAVRMNYHTKM